MYISFFSVTVAYYACTSPKSEETFKAAKTILPARTIYVADNSGPQEKF